MKKRFFSMTALVLSILLMTSVAFGAGPIAKTLKVYYRDIKIKIDGNIKSSGETQPFLYNGSTYVPLRFISEAMGKTVAWDDKQNLITITEGPHGVKSLKDQLAQKDNELYFLRNQQLAMANEIASLKKELEEAKAAADKKYSRKDFEDYLYDEYGSFHNMTFDFFIKETRSAVELTIELNKNRYRARWDNLSKYKLENWLEDIYYDVTKEYPKLKFSGTLEDTYDDDVLVKLGESRNKLTVEYMRASGKTGSSTKHYLEDDLNDYYGWGLDYYDKDFGDMEADIYVDIDDSWEDIYITIEVDTKKYDDEWYDTKGGRGAETWIRDIVDHAQDEYPRYYIDGIIKDYSNKTLATFSASTSGRTTISWK